MSKSNRTRQDNVNFPGQHLLVDKHLIRELVGLARLKPGDTVLDLGAGTGALTLPLAEQGAKVLAVEKDPALAGKLLEKIRQSSNTRLIQKDILGMTFPKEPFCVVANIPYSITTPILGKLLDQPNTPFRRAVLLVELGAARRFTADPIRSPRILKWRMWFDLTIKRSVPPGRFSPPPRVDSAVLLVSRKNNPILPVQHHARFAALAEYGLRNPQLPVFEALGRIFTPPQLARMARDLKLDRDQPAGTLNERQWAGAFLTMLKHVEPYRWPKGPVRR
ncbi:23S ribosomal RNA methyltransferase Erm [Paenibacillus sp. P26]|nr:23S ribosomal RNA methyltransferase Erm [Paenibacillus sp. P26]UUZ91865.1 23S ribosomal RNA methyltransferase Erm [Paenibacillus sp. P25]